MNKRTALRLLKSGRYQEWNQYRLDHPDWFPDLNNTDLRQINFRNNFFDMRGADVRGADMPTRYFLPIVPAHKDVHTMPSWIDTVDLDLDSSVFDEAIYDINTKFDNPSDASYFQGLGARFVNDFDFRDGDLPTLPKVFISYARKDMEVVHAIAKWLHIKGVLIKIDIGSFFAGENIRAEILRVMRECEIVLIFYSNASKDRPWVVYERELAYDLEMEAKTTGAVVPRIIYVVLDDSIMPEPVAKNRIAIMAKGQKFLEVCRQIYNHILMIPRVVEVDLRKWRNRTL